MFNNVDPKYIIVDIRDILRDYATCSAFFSIYRYFPLQEIIQCILSVNVYEDDGEYFWNEIEIRLDRENSTIVLDYEKIALFHELLCEYLDSVIRSHCPKTIDTDNYVFHRWVGHTAVMIERDENARSCNRSL
jgi:hypothetical protein